MREGGLNAARAMGRLTQRQSHFHAGQCAGEHQIVEVAQVADPEYFVGKARKAIAQRHVECLEDGGAEGVGKATTRSVVQSISAIIVTAMVVVILSTL